MSSTLSSLVKSLSGRQSVARLLTTSPIHMGITRNRFFYLEFDFAKFRQLFHNFAISWNPLIYI